MKSLSRRFLGCLLAVGLFTLMSAAPPKDDGWKAVEESMKKQLPKTAIEQLQPIIDRSITAKNYDEAIKAIAMKIGLEASIQGGKPEEKITRLQAAIATAPDPMKPTMQTILANWYWSYFQQNRWRFMQRTQTSEPASDDFTTWDLSRILSEIDKHFSVALAASEQLKNTPVGDFTELLTEGSAPDTYRPTLYDILAHNALQFYSAGEQAGAKEQDAFEVSADSPIFSGTSDFLAWQPETKDTDSPTLKAVKLYQELLRFHANDGDSSARLDVDLLRLKFADNIATGEVDDRFRAALVRFEKTSGDHPITARAMYERAAIMDQQEDLVGAHKLANEAVARFKDSVGARRCQNLIQGIEKKALAISTERVWTGTLPRIDVTYRNVTDVYFRLVALDYENFVASNRNSVMNLSQEQREQLPHRRVVHEWSAELPATSDFKQRTENLEVPEDLPPGSYYMIASHRKDFRAQDNYLAVAEVWISDLALVHRAQRGDGIVDGFVLDANSGDPIAGAKVRVWTSNRNDNRREMPSVVTNDAGMYRIVTPVNSNVMLLAEHNGHSLSSIGQIGSQRNRRDTRPGEQTRFFTDRAIYRPGQTIHYKGICIRFDQAKDNYTTLSDQAVTVIFADANGKEIQRIKHRTNGYGSFSGSVTAPRDRLMGQMSLRAEGPVDGYASIRVEEYKRPKFRVAIESPEDAPKLGGDVKVVGKATAYSGVAIGDAKVAWRVVREVRYPLWWRWRCWWMPPGDSNSQEIAHGESTTRSDGTFDIDFIALPDESVSEASEPTFVYSISADVTDTTGETRSASSSVRIGYTALSASMTADDWLTDDEPVKIAVATESLDGRGQTAECSIKIHHVLQPEKVIRSTLETNSRDPFGVPSPPGFDDQENIKSSDPNAWPLGELVFEDTVETDGDGRGALSKSLAAGLYRVLLQTKDRFGKSVTAMLPLQVLDPDADNLNIKLPELFAGQKESVEPGEEYSLLWGSGYETARVFIEIEHRGKILSSYWTEPGVTQHMIKQRVTETMRGGFSIHTTMVRENRAYLSSKHVDVPWTNKELDIKWERFVSKLEPGAKETWTATIRGTAGTNEKQKLACEMVAALYDASLDAYAMHKWPSGFGAFRFEYTRLNTSFNNIETPLNRFFRWNRAGRLNESLTYRQLPPELVRSMNRNRFRRSVGRGEAFGFGGFAEGADLMMPEPAAMAMADSVSMDSMSLSDAFGESKSLLKAKANADDGGSSVTQPNLDNVSARKNLNETAFFFPHLLTDKEGNVKIEFTMPEALTQWKFLGFAHDNELRGGFLSGSTVTAKDLMIQPNPPRFVREGDEIEFTVKVSNQSPTRQTGTVRLAFADARTLESVDASIGNEHLDQAFDVATGESKTFSWRLEIPDDLGFLTYKAVGSTGRLSDGEEGFLPVLSRRILVTESLPLPIRGKQTKQFDFEKLVDSGDSDSLKHKSLTVQMVSNPSWYAVMALPYLMEFPHECAEQTFNRLYANALAGHIAASDPKIHRVFEQWRATPALDSPLAKNQDLKAVMIEETPWLRQSENESQARRNVGILFDDNRTTDETSRALLKLTEMQLGDGRWPWFPGGGANDYITLYITTGFGRMRHLGVRIDMQAALRSVTALDAWVTKIYNDIPKDLRDKRNLTQTIALYLYGRSFFKDDQPVAGQHKVAFDYWVNQAKDHWADLGNRQSQAHIAVAMKRLSQLPVAEQIVRSLRERSVSSDEMGMFWRDSEASWWWYRAPIESQAMMIEAFDEVANDQQAVEDCKVWLLKQKQTQDWKTTKATADAVYALLLRGSDLLASDALAEVTLGGEPIKPENVEAGTGFFQQRFTGGDIRPAQGNVTVTKTDDGVAWGSLHWQYLEDMSKITPHEGTPLKLTKQLFVKKNTDQGPTLTPVAGPIEVGDELVVRVVLRTDRAMEYVHLKDYRGSGTEPVNVLSRYRYQDGLGYYESTRDTASHFFIDYLPKGTYVFEYSTRVQLKGRYQTGIANIQCMYAPEFNSHSESLEIEVQ